MRGAFGQTFRKLVCIPECASAAHCPIREHCAYARIFEPQSAGPHPSGLTDLPRPFVFRARHLDGRTLPFGAPFHFDVHLFDVVDPPVVWFVLAFAQLAREGVGTRGGKAALDRVEQLDLHGAPIARLFEEERFSMRTLEAPAQVNLAAAVPGATRVKVRFLSPVELKEAATVAHTPEFGLLFARLRDRVSTLRALYGDGPLAIDFKAMGERAREVKLERCELRWEVATRRSGRTGQVHGLGGFVGEAVYAGDLAEFIPYLELARWVGVGRQTVWGKGELEVAKP